MTEHVIEKSLYPNYNCLYKPVTRETSIVIKLVSFLEKETNAVCDRFCITPWIQSLCVTCFNTLVDALPWMLHCIVPRVHLESQLLMQCVLVHVYSGTTTQETCHNM